MGLYSVNKTSPRSVALHKSVTDQVMGIEPSPGQRINLSKKEIAPIVESIFGILESWGYYARVLEWFDDPVPDLFFGVSFHELSYEDESNYETRIVGDFHKSKWTVGHGPLDVREDGVFIDPKNLHTVEVRPREIARITSYGDGGETLFIYLIPDEEMFRRLDTNYLRMGNSGESIAASQARQVRGALPAVRSSASLVKSATKDYGADVTSRRGRLDYESSIVAERTTLPLNGLSPQERVAAILLRYEYGIFGFEYSDDFKDLHNLTPASWNILLECFGLGSRSAYDEFMKERVDVSGSKVFEWLGHPNVSSMHRACLLTVGYSTVDIANSLSEKKGILSEAEADAWLYGNTSFLSPEHYLLSLGSFEAKVACVVEYTCSGADYHVASVVAVLNKWFGPEFAGDEPFDPSLESNEYTRRKITEFICPAHGDVRDIGFAVHLSMGISPGFLSGGELSDKQALEWMCGELYFVPPAQYKTAIRNERYAAALVAEQKMAQLGEDDGESFSAVELAVEQFLGRKLPDVEYSTDDEDKASLERLVAFICPAYPKAKKLRNAIGITLGMTPVRLSDDVLSKKEAHEWLSSGMDNMYSIDWLLRDLTIIPQGKITSPNVARWLLAANKRGGLGQLTRLRVQYGPQGQRMEFRFLDVLDEVHDVDLVNGPNTSIERAFEAASERGGDSYNKKFINNHRYISKHPNTWKLVDGARFVTTPSELVREGDEMRHCVGKYIGNVQEGYSAIVAMNLGGERSTFEVRLGDSVVTQHYGFNDKSPPRVCVEALEQMMKTNRWTYGQDCPR